MEDANEKLRQENLEIHKVSSKGIDKMVGNNGK